MNLFKPAGQNSNAAAFLEAAKVISQVLAGQAKEVSIHLNLTPELNNALTVTSTVTPASTTVSPVK
jgi:hypothetical protein